MARLIAALILGLVSVAASANPHPNTAKYIESGWTAACLIKGVNCDRIPVPIVRFATMPYGEQGRYWIGSGQIVVNVRYMDDPYLMVVVAHEMTHYLQFIMGELRPGPSITMRCNTEREAFGADEKVGRFFGLEKHSDAFSWDSAAASYGCTPDQLKR